MYDLYPDQHVDGEVILDGENILAPTMDVTGLRARIGRSTRIWSEPV
jgi:phosphate transport system ATP-binding protein